MTDTRPVFLICAATNAPGQGVTGAAIGTQTVTDMLAAEYRIDWVPLHTNGLGQLAARGLAGRVTALVQALGASLGMLARLAFRGVQSPRVAVVYMLPAASTMGVLRNAATVAVVRVFHRRAKLVFHIRNGNYFERMSPWKERLQRYVNRRADCILVLSRLLLPRDLSPVGVHETQLRILPNTIDETVLPATLPAHRAAVPPLKVLYLSNFIPEKGYGALLAAAEVLATRGRGAHFALTLHGQWLSEEDRHTAEARAAALTARGLQVHVGGSLHDRAAVQALYADHHLFCLPTLYAAEAQPRSVLEAMANGCAVLATRYRSIPEQVIDGDTGFLVDDQDPQALADRLEAALAGDVAAMGRAGRALFEARFSRASVHARLLDSLRGAPGQGARTDRGTDHV